MFQQNYFSTLLKEFCLLIFFYVFFEILNLLKTLLESVVERFKLCETPCSICTLCKCEQKLFNSMARESFLEQPRIPAPGWNIVPAQNLVGHVIVGVARCRKIQNSIRCRWVTQRLLTCWLTNSKPKLARERKKQQKQTTRTKHSLQVEEENGSVRVFFRIINLD